MTAKTTLTKNEIIDLIAELPEADAYAALLCLAMRRGQCGDQRNIDGMFRGIVELVKMLAGPMGQANRMRVSVLLSNAADQLIDGQDCSTSISAERVH